MSQNRELGKQQNGPLLREKEVRIQKEVTQAAGRHFAG
jgi:hypothetical protein